MTFRPFLTHTFWGFHVLEFHSAWRVGQEFSISVFTLGVQKSVQSFSSTGDEAVLGNQSRLLQLKRLAYHKELFSFITVVFINKIDGDPKTIIYIRILLCQNLQKCTWRQATRLKQFGEKLDTILNMTRNEWWVGFVDHPVNHAIFILYVKISIHFNRFQLFEDMSQ